MWIIFRKELNDAFSSLTAYISIGVFIIALGLVTWILPETSLLEYDYASLDTTFEFSPWILLLLIPAISMRSFAAEKSEGTFEWITTKPISDNQIVIGKYFAALLVVVVTLMLVFVYAFTINQLGTPPGNLDDGATLGSFIGLVGLSAVFTSVGLWASSISQNQVVAFLLAVFICFFLYWGIDGLSKFPAIMGTWDDVVQRIGLAYHYQSVSRGLLSLSDMLYFISMSMLFLAACIVVLDKRKW